MQSEDSPIPTIIDALTISLGIDAGGVKRGAADTRVALKQVQTDADKVSKEMEASGKRAAEYFSQIKVEALGLIGILLGGKGIAAFVKDATTSMAELGRQAKNIGESAQSVAAFGFALERNGGSAESAKASLQGYADAIENFRVTGQGDVPKWLGLIGASLADKPIEAFEKFQKYVEAHKDQPGGVQLINLVGKGLGFDQGSINAAIQIGTLSSLLKELGESYKLGVPTDEQIRRAQELSKSWDEMRQSADNLGNAILTDLEPQLKAALDTTRDFITQNPELAKNITKVTEALVALAAVRISANLLGLTALGETLGPIVAALVLIDSFMSHHGPESAAGADRSTFGEYGPVSQWWQNNMPTWLGGRPGGASNERLATVRDKLATDLGIPTDAAAGIVSNLDAESGLLGINEQNPAPGTRGGFGWAQWTGPRRLDFEKWVTDKDLDPRSDEANYGYLVHELQTKYPDLLAQLKSGRMSPQDAANAFFRYESGGDPGLEKNRMGHVARAGEIAKLGRPSTASEPPPQLNLGRTLLPDPGQRSSLPSAAPAGDTSSTEVNIGTVVVHTQATDAGGVAKSVKGAITQELTTQSNRGLQ